MSNHDFDLDRDESHAGCKMPSIGFVIKAIRCLLIMSYRDFPPSVRVFVIAIYNLIFWIDEVEHGNSHFDLSWKKQLIANSFRMTLQTGDSVSGIQPLAWAVDEQIALCLLSYLTTCRLQACI